VENSLYVALSSQMALRRMLDVTANNVANMNTAAFRAERPVFDSFIQRGKGTPGAAPVAFTVDRATYTDTREGPVQTTGNPLDIAVRGDGWLRLDTPDGPRYSRDGRLNRDAEGRLVSLDGHPVLDDGGGEIIVPEDVAGLRITGDGVLTADSGAEGELGRIGLFRLPGAAALERDAGGLVRFDGDAVPADGAHIVQGAIESANVQPIAEMVRLVELTRAYGQATRIVEGEHERQRNAINRIGGQPG